MRLRGSLVAMGAVVAAVGVSAPAPLHAQDRSDWPGSIIVGTASQGGTYFVYGSGWANLVQDVVGINAGAEVTGGPVQNATLVQTGQMQFGQVTMGPAYDAWTGESSLAPGLKHDKVRAIFPMYQTSFHGIAPAGAGVGTMRDLAGKTVGFGPATGTAATMYPRFFSTLGVDSEARHGGAADLTGQLQDGLIDAFAFAAGIPIPVFSQFEAQQAASIFAFTPDDIDTLVAAFPSVSAFDIPAATYSTLDADLPTLSMWNFAISSADVPESLVYEVVKTVMENHDRMLQVHKAAKETLAENIIYNAFLPFHAGAVRYFQEQGLEIPTELIPAEAAN